jgi:hypothetical protein
MGALAIRAALSAVRPAMKPFAMLRFAHPAELRTSRRATRPSFSIRVLAHTTFF